MQPFTLLTIAWRGKGDLKNLTQVECPDHSCGSAAIASSMASISTSWSTTCWKRTPRSRKCLTPMPVPSWRWPTATPELPLRRFEFLLLQALGYAVDFEYAADDESPIQPELLYGFERELGFVACERAPDPRTLFLGAHLLALPRGASTVRPCCRRPSVSAGWHCSPIWGGAS